MTSQPALGRVDHLVWSTPDLDAGIRKVQQLTGVRAVAGGSHPGFGTRNALLSLGNRTYLEIIGPDPQQADYRSPRVFRLDCITEPRLITWAANTTTLAEFAGMSFPDGQSIGQIRSMSRRRTDGVILEWQMTDPYAELADGVVPFLIDWGATPHPADTGPQELALVELRLQHPYPDATLQKLAAIGVGLEVRKAAQAGLTAVIDSPRGVVELS